MSVTRDVVRLTSLSHGAGCACKLSPLDLRPLLAGLTQSHDPSLLVGFDKADDAAVYRLGESLAAVLTADFFTPIVDDPFDFGRVAATNAFSDVYAMGATPIMAINLVAFSISDLGAAVLRKVLEGGSAAAEGAGVAVAGGHSIDDPEPKYGMAVVGTVDPNRLLTNAGGQPGDQVYLTKPIGGGLITTAAKRGLASTDLIERATAVMCELNAQASTEAIAAKASAMTDVTGFGLLGHLHELADASGLAAELQSEAVPVIEGAAELAKNPSCRAGGSKRNLEYAEGFTAWASELPLDRQIVLTDAMTSGGLLIAVPPTSASVAPGARIAQLVEGEPGSIRVT